MFKELFKPRSLAFYGSLLCMVFFLDRMSKWWSLSALAAHQIAVIPGFNLSLCINYGVSWSLFSTKTYSGQWLLFASIFAIFTVFLGYSITQYRAKIGLLPEIFIIGGAASNLIDRLIYGGVIDFLDLYIIDWHWPTFNIADCAIIFGAILICIRGLYDND